MSDADHDNNRINPWASPIVPDEAASGEIIYFRKRKLKPFRPNVLIATFRWCILGYLAAAPSFVMGYIVAVEWHHILAMLLGIHGCIAFYVAFECSQAYQQLRLWKYVDEVLFKLFAMRIGLTFTIFGALFVDFPLGCLAWNLTSLIWNIPYQPVDMEFGTPHLENFTFLQTLTLTCIQIMLVHIVMLLLFALVYAVLIAFRYSEKESPYKIE